MQVDRICKCGSLVIDAEILWRFGTSNLEFFNSSGRDRINLF